jgi:hypothetical protein
MAWTMEAVRDRLASQLSTYGMKQSYSFMPSTPVLPCNIIAPASGTFATRPSMDDDVRDLTFTVTTLVSKVVDENAQKILDTHISPDGVWDALESGAVANTWDYAAPTAQTGYGAYTFGAGEAAQQYLGFVTQVTVCVS